MTKVVNLRKEKYDEYIGRKGRFNDGYFGNPFPVKNFGRDNCLKAYKFYFDYRLKTDPEFKEKVESLRGKVLGCFCKPNPCHGDVIVEYLESNTESTSIEE